MAKGSSIIKDLDNQIRQGRTAASSELPKENKVSLKEEPLAEGVKSEKQADVSKITNADLEDKSSVEKKKSADKEKLPAVEKNDLESFIKLVNEWDRDKGSQKSMIRIDDNLNAFFGIVKNTTGLPAVQVVNYILNDFIKKNQGIVSSIYKKTRENLFANEEIE